MKINSADIVIVGAGAAGLMAGIWAGRTNPNRRIVLLDGAKKLGAKILVAGGGRCNVTHHQVDASAFAGSSPNAIKKVLRRFDVPQTVEFFQEQGVVLKREETGKLFPTTDSSKTILNALLSAARVAQVEICCPQRVETIARLGDGFVVAGEWGELRAEKVVLATGGRSIPKSGSDGHGYKLAQGLGHSLTERIMPALVPLTLPKDHFLCQLSGITLPATLELWSGTGKRLQSFTDSTLITHFGLSGPSVLDMSRYYLVGKGEDSDISLTINWTTLTPEAFEQALLELGKKQPITLLRDHLPERLARLLLEQTDIDGAQMTRGQRKRLVELVTRYPLPIAGDRGYNYAEVTAGGVPLAELNLKTMESRLCPNLYLVGELCDVDGRIGGFNFQWAWSSGYVAGVSV
jgi:predicted Rossmann fold flavoprotein